MEGVGKTCEDCHMPMATKSAYPIARWEGDVKTHLFTINSDPKAEMFSEDGKWANGYLTVEFACLKCHLDQDKAWAAKYAKQAHTLGK
jgi:nitrate/TMAO reductase-like tetraheme cytochrome c subunit